MLDIRASITIVVSLIMICSIPDHDLLGPWSLFWRGPAMQLIAWYCHRPMDQTMTLFFCKYHFQHQRVNIIINVNIIISKNSNIINSKHLIFLCISWRESHQSSVVCQWRTTSVAISQTGFDQKQTNWKPQPKCDAKEGQETQLWKETDNWNRDKKELWNIPETKEKQRKINFNFERNLKGKLTRPTQRKVGCMWLRWSGICKHFFFCLPFCLLWSWVRLWQ